MAAPAPRELERGLWLPTARVFLHSGLLAGMLTDPEGTVARLAVATSGRYGGDHTVHATSGGLHADWAGHAPGLLAWTQLADLVRWQATLRPGPAADLLKWLAAQQQHADARVACPMARHDLPAGDRSALHDLWARYWRDPWLDCGTRLAALTRAAVDAFWCVPATPPIPPIRAVPRGEQLQLI